MNRFNSKSLEVAYDHFLFVNEKDFSEIIEDIERLEETLTEWKTLDFIKEYEVGFILEWDETLGHLLCQSEGLKSRLKDHKIKILEKGYKYLPDFLHSISDR